MGIITNKIYICIPNEKEIDKIDWDGLSTEEYNSKTYYKIPSGGNGSDVVKKITFETLKDNVNVTLNIVSSSEDRWDFAYACDLDGTSGYSKAKYKISGNNKSITCEYVVRTKGSHWIYIGYIKDSGSNYYNDCGYFSIDAIDKEYAIRQPKEVYFASDKMNKITYGSKNILEYGLPSTISWETLTWDKSNNSYTYNTKGKLYINYYYDNNNYETYLLSSPADVPHSYEITKVNFHNINSYQGNSYNCTYKLDLSYLNTYKFNSMNNMFSGCSSLTNLDVSNLNTSKVTNMQYLFNGCTSLTYLDVSKWDTSKVTSMYGMFYNCQALTYLDVSKFDTSNVIDMYGMFFTCNKLTSLDVSNLNTSKVTNMYFMFTNCSKLTSLDVSKWDTSKVTNMQYMFFGCISLTKLDLSKWDVSNVTYMDYMFFYCSSLTTLIDGHESDSYLEALNKLKVDIDFSDCVKLNYESVYAVFNGLATVTGKTITLPRVMKGKLDADKVKIATDKGWTVAYK